MKLYNLIKNIREDIEDIDHIQTWDDIKQIFGGNVIEYPGISSKHKSGLYGKVWKIKGKELALKITTDQREIETSKRLVGKINYGVINIYKIVEVPSHRNKDNYIPDLMLKIQEFCYPIKELDKLRSNYIFRMLFDDILVNFDKEYKRIVTSNKFLEIIRKKTHPNYVSTPTERFLASSSLSDKYALFSKKHAESIINDTSIQQKIIPIFLNFIDLVNRIQQDGLDIYNLDIHAGNIMQTKEKIWKLVDF